MLGSVCSPILHAHTDTSTSVVLCLPTLPPPKPTRNVCCFRYPLWVVDRRLCLSFAYSLPFYRDTLCTYIYICRISCVFVCVCECVNVNVCE